MTAFSLQGNALWSYPAPVNPHPAPSCPSEAEDTQDNTRPCPTAGNGQEQPRRGSEDARNSNNSGSSNPWRGLPKNGVDDTVAQAQRRATSPCAFKPAGISVDAHGRVFVADCARGRVSVLTPGGQFDRCLLTAMDGAKAPKSVSIDRHGLLVVVDLSSFKLYQIENRQPFL